MFDLPGDPTLLIIGVLIVLLSLVVIFSVLISSYNFLVSRVLRLEKKQKKDDAKIRANAYKEASEILDKARKQSMRSIKQAEKEATKILSEAEIFTEDQKKLLGNKLIGLNADLLESYQKVMEKQKQESVTTLQNIISEMKQEVSEEVDEFTGVLHEGTVGVQKQVEQKIKEELLQSEKDLEKYEQDKLTKIDENIYQIAYKTSQMVLGQAISMKDHEDLVRRSLEQAKREIGVG